MHFFARSKKISGWMAVNLYPEGICAVHASRTPLAKPVIERAAFYPSDSSPLPELLEKLGKELHIGRYYCMTLLNSGEYQLLAVDAPNVPPDEMKTAIRWRLKDMLDFHIDDATIDVADVPVDKNAPARNHSMFAIAARNQIIAQRQELFNNAKIPLSVIDIPEMAQRNIAALLEQEGRGLALLSFDSTGGLLTVTFSGELYLSRRIDVTPDQLAQQNAEQKDAVFERITLELQRSLDHFDRQYHFITVSKLVISLSELGSGLQEHLATNLYIPVEMLNLETVLDLSKVPELQSLQAQQRYFLALGAALRLEEKTL